MSTAAPPVTGQQPQTSGAGADETTPRVRWALPALLVIAAGAGVSYAWGCAHANLELFYEAAVRSMASSWHDFFFGAFDPDATISVDKLPGALWVQALSVRVFGFHTWAIVLPQILEGVLTVVVLYRVVCRLAGPVAGLVAAGVVALTPAVVALDRGNISDSLLILLLVLAADATVGALLRDSTWRLLLAGFWVGLAFQTKMVEAWLVLPALGAVWVLAALGPALRRALRFAGAIALCVVVSLSWMSAVSAVPQGSRPYVDGSCDDSVFEQVFVYNGLGRVGAGASCTTGLDSAAFSSLGDFQLPGSSGPGRVLLDAGGRDVGWFVPFALVAGAVVLWRRRRRARGDPLRAAVVLWGTWLLVDLVAFSATSSAINAYYLAALAPALGALCGTGVELARREGVAGRPATVMVLGAGAVSAAYGMWLSDPAPLGVRVPLWVAAAAALVVGAWLLLGGSGRTAPAQRDDARPRLRGRRVAGVLVVSGAAAVCSLAGALDIVVAGLGPFDTPYQPASVTNVTQTEPRAVLDSLGAGLPLLLRVNAHQRYVAATYTSIVAAPLIVETGREIEPIGGFSGSIPVPSVAMLRTEVADGELRTVIAPPTPDRRLAWVRSHCTVVPPVSGSAPATGPITGITVYYCLPPRRPSG